MTSSYMTSSYMTSLVITVLLTLLLDFLCMQASRRQTRLTALELISLCAADESPKRFLHMPEDDITALCELRVRDDALKHSLMFGIGIHHAGEFTSSQV
jgi:hypothetical protein